MKVIRYEEFLKQNKIELEDLNPSLQKAILLNRQGRKRLSNLEGEKKETLLKRLVRNESKIYSELLQEFENTLMHNEFTVSDERFMETKRKLYDKLLELTPFLSKTSDKIKGKAEYKKGVILINAKAQGNNETISLKYVEDSKNKPEVAVIDFEITIDQKQKTAFAINRVLKGLYMTVYGKDGINEWPDPDINYFYYIISLSLLDWINHLLAENISINEIPFATLHSPNEQILQKLYEQENTEGLSRSFLKKSGLKISYSKNVIQVGDFILRRTDPMQLYFKLYKLEKYHVGFEYQTPTGKPAAESHHILAIDEEMAEQKGANLFWKQRRNKGYKLVGGSVTKINE